MLSLEPTVWFARPARGDPRKRSDPPYDLPTGPMPATKQAPITQVIPRVKRSIARDVVERYFAALNARDLATLDELYAKAARFRDNLFRCDGRARIVDMWSGSPKDARVKHQILEVDGDVVTAKLDWSYTLLGVRVRNRSVSRIHVRGGHIVSQAETFDFGAWARQLVPLPASWLNFAEPLLAPLLRMLTWG